MPDHKRRRPQRTTIRDVARAAGVSIGTVSLALADHGAVAEETKKRVREAVERLNYSPSAIGKALKGRRTNAIGLVVPHSAEHVFSHLYFMDVLAGVSAAANAAEMALVLSTSPTEADEEAAYVKILRSQLVDGVILASAALHDKNIARLQISSYPLVFIGRYPLDTSIPSVGIDDYGGAYQAAQHLLSHGHTRIAHISGPLNHLSALERHSGYRQALQDAGIAPLDQYCVEGDYSEAAGSAGIEALLALDDPPTALFAANDETAIGALTRLRAAGIAPGVEFPVVGYDDIRLASLATPPLTSIRQPMQQLGAEATRLLLALLRGEPPDPLQIELPTQLVLRHSCGC